jgi:hypothetical protein
VAVQSRPSAGTVSARSGKTCGAIHPAITMLNTAAQVKNPLKSQIGWGYDGNSFFLSGLSVSPPAPYNESQYLIAK